jgi:hypothetical protein
MMSIQSKYIHLRIESVLNSVKEINYIKYKDGKLNELVGLKRLYRRIDYLTTGFPIEMNTPIEYNKLDRILFKIGLQKNNNIKEIKKLRKRISRIKEDIFNTIDNIIEIQTTIADFTIVFKLKKGKIHSLEEGSVKEINGSGSIKYFIDDKEIPYEEWIILSREYKLHKSRKRKINKIIKINEKSLEM